MSNPEQYGLDGQLEKIRETLPAVAEIVTGNPDTDLMNIFPNPGDKETRDASQWKGELTSESEQEFRRRLADIGPGRTDDYGPEQAGLRDYMILHEAGQAHKVMAQERLVEGIDKTPLGHFYTGATERPLSDGEKTLTAKLLGIDIEKVSDMEDGMIAQLLGANPNFLPLNNPDSKKGGLPLKHPGFDSGEAIILKAGFIRGHSVWFMPIVRIEQPKTGRNQLTNQEKIEIVGSQTQSTVALATSSTYQPSNVIAAISARENTMGPTAVISYGTETLAKIKGEEPKIPTLDQLATEVYKAAKNLRELDSRQ